MKGNSRPYVLAAVVLLITFITFSNTLRYGFVEWDDRSHLTDTAASNSLSLKEIKRTFTSAVNKTYIPLTVLSFAVEHHFFGLDPFIYHLDNLLLHLMVTGLVFYFAVSVGLTTRAAAVAALLFGIHPMHVESVVWVTERKDVLYSFFYMSSVCCYWQYLARERRGFYICSVLLGLLSILSKPMALSLPLVLFVCDWLFRRKFELRLFFDKVPYFLCIIPLAWITYALHMRVPGGSVFEGILVWVWCFAFYIQKFFFPFVLIPLYELPEPVTLFNYHYGGAVLLDLAIVWAVIAFRKNRWLVFAFFYYFLSVFFLLRYDNAADVNIVADRFMYLPSVGFCAAVGVGTDRFLLNADRMRRLARRITYFCLGFSVCALSIKTYFQAKVWENNLVFWSYVIQKLPDTRLPYVNRASEYIGRGEYTLAMSDLKHVLSRNPEDTHALNNLASIHIKTGRWQDALLVYNTILEIDPEKVVAYYNRAELLMERGLYDEAILDYDKALAIDPRHYWAYFGKGNVYFDQKEYDRALSDYARVIDINPDYPLVYYNRSLIYHDQGKFAAALKDAYLARDLGYRNQIDSYISELERKPAVKYYK